MLDLARAKSREEGVTNVDFLQADAQIHLFDEVGFDVAISSFGAMFFADPVAAFNNIGRALGPDRRLALLAWQELARNEWVSAFRTALALGRQLPEPPRDAPSPFSLADPERVRRIVAAAGFENVEFEAIDATMDFGSDADDAYAFIEPMGIVDGLTEDLSDDQRAHALAELRKTVEAHAGADGVHFGASAWLITANATRI